MNNKTSKKIERDAPLRSVAKGLTWRFTATGTTITIAYFTLGSIDTALQIGAIEFVLKFFIYYVHERAWTCVPRGTFRRIWNSFARGNPG
jgi:adenylylsulfate kinase